MTSSCSTSGSYIYCLRHFEDLLFFCQQSPCFTHAQNLCNCLQKELGQQRTSQDELERKPVSHKSTQITNDLLRTYYESCEVPAPQETKVEDYKQFEQAKDQMGVQNPLKDWYNQCQHLQNRLASFSINESGNFMENRKYGHGQVRNQYTHGSFFQPREIRLMPIQNQTGPEDGLQELCHPSGEHRTQNEQESVNPQRQMCNLIFTRLNKELIESLPTRHPSQSVQYDSLPWTVTLEEREYPPTPYNTPTLDSPAQKSQRPQTITSSPLNLTDECRKSDNHPRAPEDTHLGAPDDTVHSIMKTSRRKYSGFYADYCGNVCSCDPCRSCTPSDGFLNSLFDPNCSSPEGARRLKKKSNKEAGEHLAADEVRHKLPTTDDTNGLHYINRRKVREESGRLKEEVSRGNGSIGSPIKIKVAHENRKQEVSRGNGSIGSPIKIEVAHGNRLSERPKRSDGGGGQEATRRKRRSSLMRSQCRPQPAYEPQCTPEERCDPGVIHVLTATPTLEDGKSVSATSTIMVLFFAMMTFYTLGLNIGEYITFKAGLHGRTFFLLPYILRSLTIGSLMTADFLSFLLTPNCLHSFVDRLLRTFVFSFLASTLWNIIEHTMEVHHLSPLVYFGGSGLICVLAVGWFCCFVNRNVC